MQTVLRRLAYGCVLLLAIAFVPVIAFPTVRAAYVNELTFKSRHVQRPLVTMVGDSLTARAAPWGWRLSLNPLAAFTTAQSGFDTREIDTLVSFATSVDPVFYHVAAGTNDLGKGRSAAEYVADYQRLLDDLHAPGERIVVTLIPPSANPKLNAEADAFNAALRPVLAKRHIRTIDLRPLLATNGILRPEMTVDGIHFTEAAYRIWAAEIRKRLV